MKLLLLHCYIVFVLVSFQMSLPLLLSLHLSSAVLMSLQLFLIYHQMNEPKK